MKSYLSALLKLNTALFFSLFTITASAVENIEAVTNAPSTRWTLETLSRAIRAPDCNEQDIKSALRYFADLSQSTKQYDEAMQAYKIVFSTYRWINKAQEGKALYEWGVICYNVKDFNQAVTNFKKVLNGGYSGTNKATANFSLGHTYYQLGMQATNEQLTQSYVQDSFDAYLNAITLTFKTTDGSPLLSDSLKKEAWLKLLDSAKSFSDHDKKIAAYEKIFQIGNWADQNEKANGLCNFGIAYLDKGKLDEALLQFKTVLEIDGAHEINKSGAYFLIGCTHREFRKQRIDAVSIQRHVQEEVRAYINVLATNPNFSRKERILQSLNELVNGAALRAIQEDYHACRKSVEIEQECIPNSPYLEFYQKHADEVAVIARGVWLKELVEKLKLTLSKG